jgi:hypothetical protein
MKEQNKISLYRNTVEDIIDKLEKFSEILDQDRIKYGLTDSYLDDVDGLSHLLSQYCQKSQ